MLETRLCSKMPSLNFQSILSDPVLARYMRSNAKKAKECAEKGYPEMPEPRKKRAQRPPVQQNDDYGGSSESSSSCSFSQVSFSEPNFQRECKFEEPMMEEEEEERGKERQVVVKVEAQSEEDKGVRLFADIRIDDI
jgi:hypothetical protein